MSRMSALSRHWAQFPPVHVSVAMLLNGGKKPEPAAPAAAPAGPTESEISELLSMFPMVTR